ncbi:acyl-CoA dehydrogenase family protein [Gammaproteobacteria bacterium]|nr:acyl-CoA dehydrogenase family protein [Gammaproteobacteria bacterium]
MSDQNQQILADMQQFVREQVLPNAGLWDQKESMDRSVINTLAEKGWLGALAPTEFGGSEMDPLLWGHFCETIGSASSSLLGLPTVHGMVIQSLARWGSDEQKAKNLPGLSTGEILGAFALTEPDFGSDAGNIQAQAVRKGDTFCLSGQKQWITYGQVANIFIVVARLEDKPTAFIVPRDTDGLKIEPVKNMLGFRAAELANLVLTDCEIPANAMLGQPGFGFSHVAGTALDHGRFCIAWGCVGLAQGALDASVSHALEREQFGKLISEHQLIQELLADMMVGTRAARGLCEQAAHLKREGDPRVIMETSIAKYFASTHAAKVSRDAVQILGGRGCSNNSNVERFFRDAKVMEIIEGSSQIQQLIISRHGMMQFRKDRRLREKIKT